MQRHIELATGLLATALGLIWLVAEVSALQSLWLTMSGAFPPSHYIAQPISVNGSGPYFAGSALAIIAVAVGAYVHTLRRHRLGVPLLWLGACASTALVLVYFVEPWTVIDLPFISILQAPEYAWMVPTIVLSLFLAWTAAIAALPLPSGRPQPKVPRQDDTAAAA
ncbi:MAG TPA: hypothetical protein VFB58_00220 [Chloroflexota bacterium]|nr:hypothetical protein [Chloroflexota bacterium]